LGALTEAAVLKPSLELANPFPAAAHTLPPPTARTRFDASATHALPASSKTMSVGALKEADSMGPSPALGVPLPANKEAVHRGTPTVPSAAEPAGQAPPHAHGTAGAAPPAHQEPGGQGTPKGATEPAGQCAPGGAAHEPEHAAVDWPAAPHLPAGHSATAAVPLQ
jgi:hypothetical protein